MNELELLKSRVAALEEELSKRKVQQISYPLDELSNNLLSEVLPIIKVTSGNTPPSVTGGTTPSENRYGAATSYLGGPTDWIMARLPNGKEVKIPYY